MAWPYPGQRRVQSRAAALARHVVVIQCAPALLGQRRDGRQVRVTPAPRAGPQHQSPTVQLTSSTLCGTSWDELG